MGMAPTMEPILTNDWMIMSVRRPVPSRRPKGSLTRPMIFNPHNPKSKYKVNKEKCIGCGLCVATCPEGMELGEDGKAKVIDRDKVERCGGEALCPYQAIEEVK